MFCVNPRPLPVTKHSQLVLLAGQEKDVTITRRLLDLFHNVLCLLVLSYELDELPLTDVDGFAGLVYVDICEHDFIVARRTSAVS